MSEGRCIEEALRAAGMAAPVAAIRPLEGGCIHRVRRVTLAGGASLIAKIAPREGIALLREEAAGLRALRAAGPVRVPEVVEVGEHAGAAVLLMEGLDPVPAGERDWSRFGGELAALHAAAAGPAYGFDHDNHLGTTPQPNGWCDDWVRFNAERRLGHQLDLAARRGVLEPAEAAAVERVVARLGDLLPARPPPALLHGDLWHGNALACAGGDGRVRIALVDPACSFGDGWADVAMMRLFGGFPDSAFASYAAAAGSPPDIDDRIAVYQLYHALNHLNLFGRGYAAMVMGLVAKVR